MQVVDSPWLTASNQRLVYLLLQSYQQAFNRPFHVCHADQSLNRVLAQEVFALDIPLMAHGNEMDPILMYVNACALRIWRRQWQEMVGMPSRLTAPIEEQKSRSSALKNASRYNAIENYQGIRVNGEGERFSIHGARIWTIWDTNGKSVGQAATFTNWQLITPLNA